MSIGRSKLIIIDAPWLSKIAWRKLGASPITTLTAPGVGVGIAKEDGLTRVIVGTAKAVGVEMTFVNLMNIKMWKIRRRRNARKGWRRS